MAYEKRKTPKVKIKQKEDKLAVEKIEMKERKAPSRKKTVKKSDENHKINNDFKSTFHLLSGGKKEKKLKKRHSIITAYIFVFIIISVLVIHFITPTGIVEWSQNMFITWGSGGGMPVPVSGDSVKNMQTRSDGVFVVTDSHLYAYNSSGKQMSSIQHGYSQPAFDLSASRTLIYDRGSLGLRVDALYANIVNVQLKEEIITADICDRGFVAVATKSTDYTAQVTVYDKSFKNIFRWSSPDGYVSCIKLSDNGKYVAVCTVTGKNGDYCSNINVFNCSSGERVLSKQILGSMFLSASSNNKFITFAGTDSVVSMRWDGTDQLSYEYYNLDLVNMDNKGCTVAVYHPDGDERKFTVSILGKDGKEKSHFSLDGSVSKICADSRYIYVYNNGVINKYLYDGTFKDKFEIGYEYVFVSPFKNKIAYISDMKLDIN